MSLFLAACGGGGGSSGGSASLNGSVPPGGGSTGGGLTSTTVERSDAQSALAGVQAYVNAETGDGGVLTIRRMLERVDTKAIFAHVRREAQCETNSTGGGGFEDTTVVNSNDTETVTVETYYDTACTEPDVELVWTASQSGDSITGPATYTQYSETGATDFTANAQVTFYYTGTETDPTVTGISLLLTGITGSDTGSLASMGLACSEATDACSSAVIENTSGGQDGAVVDLAIASTVSMQVQGYQGASLSIGSGTFPDWTISPSSDETTSVSMTGGATSGGGFTLTLTDNINGGTFSISGSASGTVTGTLTATGSSTTDASFTINASGNGTLTYGNGTTASIVDYVIQS